MKEIEDLKKYVKSLKEKSEKENEERKEKELKKIKNIKKIEKENELKIKDFEQKVENLIKEKNDLNKVIKKIRYVWT